MKQLLSMLSIILLITACNHPEAKQEQESTAGKIKARLAPAKHQLTGWVLDVEPAIVIRYIDSTILVGDVIKLERNYMVMSMGDMHPYEMRLSFGGDDTIMLSAPWNDSIIAYDHIDSMPSILRNIQNTGY